MSDLVFQNDQFQVTLEWYMKFHFTDGFANIVGHLKIYILINIVKQNSLGPIFAFQFFFHSLLYCDCMLSFSFCCILATNNYRKCRMYKPVFNTASALSCFIFKF